MVVFLSDEGNCEEEQCDEEGDNVGAGGRNRWVRVSQCGSWPGVGEGIPEVEGVFLTNCSKCI